MNWKTYVATQNAKTFVLPAGWDSREDIAEQLDCSPDRVREHLQPGIAAREIESRQFPVWDAELGRKIVVTAYRKIEAQAEATRPTEWGKDEIALAKQMLKEKKTYREIAAATGRSRAAVKKWCWKNL